MSSANVGVRPQIPTTNYMGCTPKVVQPIGRRPTMHDTARRAPQDIKGDILKIQQDLLGYVRSMIHIICYYFSVIS